MQILEHKCTRVFFLAQISRAHGISATLQFWPLDQFVCQGSVQPKHLQKNMLQAKTHSMFGQYLEFSPFRVKSLKLYY